MQCTYQELLEITNTGLACVVFVKKKGEIRYMLCTRNLDFSNAFIGYYGSKLGMFDAKYTYDNNNFPVIDLVVQDVRTVAVNRMLYAQPLALPKTREQLNTMLNHFEVFKEKCMQTIEQLTVNSLDALDENHLTNCYIEALDTLRMQDIELSNAELFAQRLLATPNIQLYDI